MLTLCCAQLSRVPCTYPENASFFHFCYGEGGETSPCYAFPLSFAARLAASKTDWTIPAVAKNKLAQACGKCFVCGARGKGGESERVCVCVCVCTTGCTRAQGAKERRASRDEKFAMSVRRPGVCAVRRRFVRSVGVSQRLCPVWSRKSRVNSCRRA